MIAHLQNRPFLLLPKKHFPDGLIILLGYESEIFRDDCGIWLVLSVVIFETGFESLGGKWAASKALAASTAGWILCTLIVFKVVISHLSSKIAPYDIRTRYLPELLWPQHPASCLGTMRPFGISGLLCRAVSRNYEGNGGWDGHTSAPPAIFRARDSCSGYDESETKRSFEMHCDW
jgi:hypothetical protein